MLPFFAQNCVVYLPSQAKPSQAHTVPSPARRSIKGRLPLTGWALSIRCLNCSKFAVSFWSKYKSVDSLTSTERFLTANLLHLDKQQLYLKLRAQDQQDELSCQKN
jgi:hypothetical protein